MICPFCIKPYNLQPGAKLAVVFRAEVLCAAGQTQAVETACPICPDCWDTNLSCVEKYEHGLVKDARQTLPAAA